MKPVKLGYVLILIFLFQSCATTKKLGVDKLSYANVVEAINGGLFKAKEDIDKSQYELKEGSIKLYTSGKTSAEAGISFWIIEGGYNWSAEGASTVTYKFSKIEPVKILVSDEGTPLNPITPPNLKSMIQSAIKNFDSVDAISDLDREGFDLNVKFGITETANGKFKLDFGVGANLSGSKSNSVAHEITLSFKKKNQG